MTLTDYVVLGALDDPATCNAWLEQADRRCGKPATLPHLCALHVTVAHRRKRAAEKKAAAQAARRAAERAAAIPSKRDRLRTVEATIARLDPPTSGDPAVVNLPIARRLPSDATIARLADLHRERERLLAWLGKDA